jgi:hypothetical protein
MLKRLTSNAYSFEDVHVAASDPDRGREAAGGFDVA